MKLRDAPLDEPSDAKILTAWRNAPSFLRDAQMTEAFPNPQHLLARRAIL
ncbi:hypothetical protein A2U01_0098701, partial [Trifolium medium]|nr:hypothetical protein [Trifolium medium]